ncbi:MAG: ABC transporter permease [Bdellovibrionales bacterium]|nr:ABC transporter permease [Bdellovibrionales bacterium]
MKNRIGKYLGVSIAVGMALSIALDFLSFEGPFPDAVFWFTILASALGSIHLVIKKNLFVYVTKRGVEAAVTIFVIATVTFLMLRFLPGGPFDSEKALPPDVKANIEKKYNLNAPVTEQYTNYIGGLIQGDLGTSYKYIGRDVTTIIGESMGATFKLGFYSLLLSFLVGIPLGVLAAHKHNTWIDNTAMATAISGVALPNFLVGAVLILVFAIHLQVLPAALWETPAHYILPVLTLGLRPISIIARMTRSSVLDVIKADYVRTAWAKGLDEKVVLFKHVLRNSLVPVLSISGPLVANVLSGSFVVEVIFAVPGMGKHLVQSVSNRDYPLILGLTLLYSVILILCNLIVDLLYSIVDPRIKLSS